MTVFIVIIIINMKDFSIENARVCNLNPFRKSNEIIIEYFFDGILSSFKKVFSN